MASFQGSSEFSGDKAHTLELRPSVGRFPSSPVPSPLSVIGSASPAARNVNTIAPGHGLGGNLPDSAQLQAQQQQQHSEQGNLRRHHGDGTRQLFNPVPTKDGCSRN